MGASASRYELPLTLLVLSALIVARSLVFAVYEHSYFDSDQAIVGLMAKHLSEGRAFPLFFYGQPYMLAVEAWWMVPFFWIAGPTVAALRASLIATNIAVVVLLVVGLVRAAGLRPALAGVGALWFAMAPPVTAAFLVEAQGGNVEPFFWILALWFLRARPLVFGALLAIAFLNREFSIYAAVVLGAADLFGGTGFRRERLRHWLLVGVAFLLVMETVQAATRFADARGPGTRGAQYTDSQMENLTRRMALQDEPLIPRAWAFVYDIFPGLVGARRLEDTVAAQGHDWLRWVMWAAIVIAIGRIAALKARSLLVEIRARPFPWYLIAVGITALGVVLLTRPLAGMLPRYLLLTLLIPIGLTAALFALEPRRSIRRAAIVFVAAWALLSAVDHARLFHRYAVTGEPNYLRELTDALVARGVSVTEAPYWRAYKITFLAEEAVKVGALEFVRIDEYQRLAAAEGDKLRVLSERPCDGGEPVAVGWFLCPVTRRP